VVEAVGVAPSPEFIVAAKAGLTATGRRRLLPCIETCREAWPHRGGSNHRCLVERARLAGIETPLLAAIYTHLCVYQCRVLA